MNGLINRHCNSNPEFAPKLDRNEYEDLMVAIDREWGLDFSAATLSGRLEFKNFYQTIAFASSVAGIAHRQDHHPDMIISYKHCSVSYTTHSVDGLSINDFICVARIDALMQ